MVDGPAAVEKPAVCDGHNFVDVHGGDLGANSVRGVIPGVILLPVSDSSCQIPIASAGGSGSFTVDSLTATA